MVKNFSNDKCFSEFLNRHSEIPIYTCIVLTYFLIISIVSCILLCNYYINYPSEEAIESYQSISEHLMTGGITSFDDYEDFNVKIISDDITLNDVLCSRLSDINLEDVDIYLKFENFYVKNNFSDVFTFYHKNNKLSMINVDTNNRYGADVMYIEVSKFEIAFTMPFVMLIFIAVYTIIAFINFIKTS